MANPERGERGVDVDGQRYTLRPSFNSVAELEDLIGKGIDEVIEAYRQRRMNSALRTVVWMLLNDEHGSEIRTLKDASRWIERAGGPDVVTPWVNDVLELNATPDEAKQPKEGGANPLDAQAGIGERSSLALVESA